MGLVDDVDKIRNNNVSNVFQKTSAPSQIAGSNAFKDYVNKIIFFSHIPKDRFSHAFRLLQTEQNNIENYADVLNQRHIFLGNIDNARVLRCNQNDAMFFYALLSLARRDVAMKEVFDVIFWSWVLELRLTSTKKGKERDLQAFLIPRTTEGFRFPLRKKKQEPMDYIIPDEEEGGMY